MYKVRKKRYRRTVRSHKKADIMALSIGKIAKALSVAFFAVLFYHFFIRPYAYRWRFIPGREGYGVCMPVGYKVHGIDVSHYQGVIDWNTLRKGELSKYPIRFVFVKATDGSGRIDENFARNFENARLYGFIRGAYHYYNPDMPAMQQADLFINQVRLEAGDLPPVLDVEKIGDKNKNELKVSLKVWLDRVEMHYGVKPIIYASYKFRKSYLSDSVFNKYPYWIAHYYVDSVAKKQKWTFWQHTDIATIPGIKKDVDLNIFNGSLADLQSITIGKE